MTPPETTPGPLDLRRAARLAGWLYLPVVLTGPFLLLYVPKKIFVTGDASATVSNILAHETLFRAQIVMGLVSELLFIAAILALYRLLRGVQGTLAILMLVPILLDAPLTFLGAVNEVAALRFARDPAFLAVFEKPQRDALATLLVEFGRQGVLVSEVFWGLWLLPLRLLVYRSGFMPRPLGVWLLANGAAYIAISLTGLLLPQYMSRVAAIATPVLFGEMALMLWLVLAGARVRRPAARDLAPRAAS